MPVNLSIKNVPDDLAQRLRARAARNHRSLQGELMSMLEQMAYEEAPENPAAAVTGRLGRKLSISEAAAVIQKLGIRSPSDSVQILRHDRMRDDL